MTWTEVPLWKRKQLKDEQETEQEIPDESKEDCSQ